MVYYYKFDRYKYPLCGYYRRQREIWKKHSKNNPSYGHGEMSLLCVVLSVVFGIFNWVQSVFFS